MVICHEIGWPLGRGVVMYGRVGIWHYSGDYPLVRVPPVVTKEQIFPSRFDDAAP